MVEVSKERAGSQIVEIKTNWETLTSYMCKLYDHYHNNAVLPDNEWKNPKNDIITMIKKFENDYDTYFKGRGIILSADKRDLEVGEPTSNGFL